MPSSARYLHVPVADVVAHVRHGRADADDLDRVVALLRAVQHATYDARWQAARLAFDSPSAQAVPEQLREVLRSANYSEVPGAVLERALGESAVSRVRVEVDLDAFAELALFRRSTSRQSAEVGRWVGWRRRERVEHDTYDRVVLHARVRPQEWFDAQEREAPLEPGSTHLKLFQDVPELDVEMLVPGIEVTMRTVDKVVLGVPALLSGIVVAVTKLGAALVLAALLVAASIGLRDERPDIDTGALVTLLGGVVAVGSFLWRQWSKIRTRRYDYLRRLSQSLYLKTLADGPGVLYALLDEAEEQDLKEALLAYRALLDEPGSVAAVGARVGAALGADLEVEDALSRLRGLGLAHEADGLWTVLPAAEAVPVLRRRWDDIGDALAGSTRIMEG